MPVVSRPKASKEIGALSDILYDDFSLDELQRLYRDVTNQKPPTRKADVAEAFSEYLLGPQLRQVFDRLDNIDKVAVSEALYSPKGYVPEQFEAMHGRAADFGSYSGYRSSPKLIRLFTRRGDNGLIKVPLVFQQRLAEFVPKPDRPTIAVTETVPLVYEPTKKPYSFQKDDPDRIVEQYNVNVTERSEAAQHELYSVLQMIQLGKIAVSEKTLLPNADMMWKISRALEGDYYQDLDAVEFETVGYIRSFAWPKIVQEAGLAKTSGKKLILTKAGMEAASQEPAEVVRSVWRRWLDCKFDEFTRIDFIKGQSGKAKRSMTNPVDRRAQIVNTLRDCPTGSWVRFEDFSKYMRACGNSFEVTDNPWLLYMSDANYGSLGYSDRCTWEVLQDRYLMCFLFEYAATLGLIDIAFVSPYDGCRNFRTFWGFDDYPYLSRYDGLLYFRINPLGAYLLEIENSFFFNKASEKKELSIMSNFRVQLHGGKLSAHETLLLESFAESAGENAWEITQAKCLEACESGMKISDLRRFLTADDDQPLPETVEALLAKVERNAEALLAVHAAKVFLCADRNTAKEIAAHSLTKKLCQITNLDTLVVKSSDEEKFRNAVRILGFGIKYGDSKVRVN